MTEYERGFIDGVKSKVTAELTPVITKMAGGLNQTIQEVVKTVIGNVKITAHEPVSSAKWDGYICSECNVCADYFISGDFYFDEKPNFCPNCGARMDLDSVTYDRCSNYMDCDGNCFIDDTPCDCNGNIEKCKGR